MDKEKVKLHEHFLKNTQGTSMSEVLWLTLFVHFNTLITIFVGHVIGHLSHKCNKDCIPNSCSKIQEEKVSIFLKEIFTVIMPLILMITVLADNVFYLYLVMISTIIVALIALTKEKINFSSMKRSYYGTKVLLKLPIHDNNRSFVTCCRSLVNILTVISILAVDFDIFPRRFAKTESYGFSLMDVGVGFFVVSNAAVIKTEKITSSGIKQTFFGSLVLYLLGIFRYYSVQSINYQKVVTEYGVHWNFFFTLGSIKLLSFVIIKICDLHLFLPGVALGVMYQVLLLCGLEQYILGNRPRDNLIDANREGLISVLGYTSLYLIGASLNKFVLKKYSTVGNDLKTVGKLIFCSIILFILTSYFNQFVPVSRRLVNLSYIMWIIAMTLIHSGVALFLELFLICFISPYKSSKMYNYLTPIIFECVNYNGLTFFLLGNAFTGLVNFLFNTIEMNKYESLLILATYVILNCFIVNLMYLRKLQLKFW